MKLTTLLILLTALLTNAQPPSLTPVHDAVAKAKREGLSTIALPPAIVEGLAFPGVDSAIKSSYVMEVAFVDKQVVLFNYTVESLVTYLHFTIHRNLTGAPIPAGKMPAHVPDRFNNLGPSELIVPCYSAAQILVDGILVTQGPDLSEFVPGQTYWMLVSFSGTPMASFAYGLPCVWKVTANSLTAIRPDSQVAKAFRAKGLEKKASFLAYLSTHSH